MFDFNTVYKKHNEQISCDSPSPLRTAVVLAFPYKLPQTTTKSVSGTFEADIIDHRMSAPLCSNEMTALMDMIKYRAKRLGQDLWVTTCNFLAMMKVEELGDLRRCDFVRSVEYLVTIDATAQA